MSTLPFQRASQLSTTGPQTQWLIEGLWSDQAVGILGGEPKCYKSFLALDVAVSVASGAACLRQFPVRRTGKVLLPPAGHARRPLAPDSYRAGSPADPAHPRSIDPASPPGRKRRHPSRHAALF